MRSMITIDFQLQVVVIEGYSCLDRQGNFR